LHNYVVLTAMRNASQAWWQTSHPNNSINAQKVQLLCHI